MPDAPDNTGTPPPNWLAEEPWLRDLLHWFLDRLEQPRTRAITRRVTRSTLPALFRFDGEAGYRWQLIETLKQHYGLFSIQLDRRAPRHEEPYANAQLRLRHESEDLLRQWLQRPRIDPATTAWQAAVAPHRQHFADQGAALLAAPITIDGYGSDEVVEAFVAVGNWLQYGLSLREISARCFRGDSKFLDGRQELLAKLYGARATGIAPRALLLTAFAPLGFRQLLIVENQDSFLRLADKPPPGFALLYSGGFRASAQRLGSEHTRFAFLPGSDSVSFHSRWLGDSLPVFFWGDLDFAGMGILKALRQRLPALAAWEPGYTPMLEMLTKGEGHTAIQAGKSGQLDPIATGCAYADSVLLPALRQHRHFVDQEVVQSPKFQGLRTDNAPS
ncbi:hypothetical protein FV139_05790 [Parahaliea maris]|uniref:Wadjet protein JetD C-terminal domain-containing protein n=1 Tax=Parahaliea maris TaxID=2716870 RepID=A0A5C9A740_9GAMM|nr:Wadjet anti-phage system protein JetD domain-containing protein [Parahaliea maris]TXS95397.1 hypothetical protein FV139_05790 [Parahaliea maris]